ncbi:MAG: SCP2 sterol-binding domain-containing protein [Deltaproteobacteria bacterium]|nr:MAG: SCP2 sterol-binding domain-containing protein [Deltaproteobacteria bacterium]
MASKFQASLLLNTMVFVLEGMSKIDEEVRKELEGWDRVIQWKVMPDGPNAYIVTKDSYINAAKGLHPEPNLSMVFQDIETTVGVLSRKLDPQDAIANQKMTIEGDFTDAMKLTGAMLHAEKYSKKVFFILKCMLKAIFS